MNELILVGVVRARQRIVSLGVACGAANDPFPDQIVSKLYVNLHTEDSVHKYTSRSQIYNASRVMGVAPLCGPLSRPTHPPAED